MADRVVDAVADDLHLDAVQSGFGHEGHEFGIDFDGVQVGLQFAFAHVEQGHLALHAFARADVAALPGLL